MAAWVPLYLDVSSAPLANVVEAVTDWDIPNDDATRDVTIQVFPRTNPYLLFQYRTPVRSFRRFRGTDDHRPPYNAHAAAWVQTGTVVVYPSGPVGIICVLLRPEAAVRVLGERLHGLANVKIDLEEVFCPTCLCLLTKQLAEASNSRERFACVQHFLLANLSGRELDRVACRAAASLRQNPFLRVRKLAADIGISERQLSRRFQSMFGVDLESFARAARVERIVSTRRSGLSWTHVAGMCGFADQAHMIHDVNAIIGAAPDQVFRDDCILAW